MKRTEILLVEDNPHDVELTLLALKRNNLSNPIHVARDGAEALEFLFGGPTPQLSLILLDLKLPKVGGREVAQQVKSDPRTRHIPLVVMTASREESDLVETYGLGVNSYIVKPVNFDNFSEAMRIVGMYWLLLNEPPVAVPGAAAT
jgi:two-component system, response regulator